MHRPAPRALLCLALDSAASPAMLLGCAARAVGLRCACRAPTDALSKSRPQICCRYMDVAAHLVRACINLIWCCRGQAGPETVLRAGQHLWLQLPGVPEPGEPWARAPCPWRFHSTSDRLVCVSRPIPRPTLTRWCAPALLRRVPCCPLWAAPDAAAACSSPSTCPTPTMGPSVGALPCCTQQRASCALAAGCASCDGLPAPVHAALPTAPALKRACSALARADPRLRLLQATRWTRSTTSS